MSWFPEFDQKRQHPQRGGSQLRTALAATSYADLRTETTLESYVCWCISNLGSLGMGGAIQRTSDSGRQNLPHQKPPGNGHGECLMSAGLDA
jgi:hypothetical protein